jgi:PBP4 family serine-type D-alanyl-D-alanine carboxypeptidase
MRILLCLLAGALSVNAESAGSFTDRVQQVMARPAFRHARFGIEVLDLERGKPLYQLNADQLFVPGSTTKLLTVGTALALLGPDYRFHTRVYRSGSLERGRLKGDLILVAAGDPNLSNRIQPDGTLAFQDIDHSYSAIAGAKVVAGDPLAVIRQLARQVAANGVKRIDGHVRIDISLFPEGEREAGTGVVISPIVVNDNVIDVTITPGAKAGESAVLTVSPESGYVHFINQTQTGASGSAVSLNIGRDDRSPGGVRSVVVEGSLPAGSKPVLRTYAVPEPSAFAAVVFAEALRKEGIHVQSALADITVKSSPAYAADAQLAEHISPPLMAEAKVVLKVSQNLHASMLPFTLGAVVGHAKEDADQAGFDLEHQFLEKAGLDLSAAAQSDGAGGHALFTPDFMVHFLAYISKQAFFPGFLNALPILGKDGTLWDIQPNSPAAGHVMAKTGTFASYNALNKNLVVDGKGLVGFVTRDGRNLAIAVYANFVAADPATATHIVGDALGEIAAAAYDGLF